MCSVCGDVPQTWFVFWNHLQRDRKCPGQKDQLIFIVLRFAGNLVYDRLNFIETDNAAMQNHERSVCCYISQLTLDHVSPEIFESQILRTLPGAAATGALRIHWGSHFHPEGKPKYMLLPLIWLLWANISGVQTTLGASKSIGGGLISGMPGYTGVAIFKGSLKLRVQVTSTTVNPATWLVS